MCLVTSCWYDCVPNGQTIVMTTGNRGVLQQDPELGLKNQDEKSFKQNSFYRADSLYSKVEIFFVRTLGGKASVEMHEDNNIKFTKRINQDIFAHAGKCAKIIS